jgi:hypothetical protein
MVKGRLFAGALFASHLSHSLVALTGLALPSHSSLRNYSKDENVRLR